jgi:drug/metabolite transporter (DMT)-like permease
MLLGGNGGVVWAEQRVPSGLTAVLIATVPLWVALLDWLWRGTRPTALGLAGLALGMARIGLLVGPGELAGSRGVDLLGAAVLVLGSLSWAAGSLYSRGARLPGSPLLSTAMEMLAGGALLLALGLATGQAGQLDLAQVSLRSVLAFGYLIVFGSLIAFTAYIWLLRATSPAQAATYAYVNPVVAVFLGWALAGEPLTARTLLAAAVIVGSVVLITAQPRPRPVGAQPEPAPAAAQAGRAAPGQAPAERHVATLADCEEAGGVAPC